MPRYKRLTPPASESQPSGLGQRLEQISPIKLFSITCINPNVVRVAEHKTCFVFCHLTLKNIPDQEHGPEQVLKLLISFLNQSHST